MCRAHKERRVPMASLALVGVWENLGTMESLETLDPQDQVDWMESVEDWDFQEEG